MIFENILLAFRSLFANKMRSFLTMLGIIIGIMSVITIVTIGNSMTASVNDQLSSFGTSNISLYVREKSNDRQGMMMMIGGGGMAGGGGGPRGGQGEQQTPESSDLISQDMIDDFEAEFEGRIDGVSLTQSVGSAKAQDHDLYANVSITGVNTAYETVGRITMLAGRYISDEDMDAIRSVAVVSEKFCDNMFAGLDYEDVLDQQVKIYEETVIKIYTIVGVYEYEQTGFGSTVSEVDISTTLYIPLTLATQDLIEKNFMQMTVIASSGEDVLVLTDEINDYFDSVYRRNSTWGITASNMESQLNSIMETLSTISMAIALIAGISLLVGGIGVMNIMLVSVTERTREIGTRKALGAKNFHIRLQFVTEAAIISVIGGLIGVILGTACGIGVSVFMGSSIVINVTITIVAIVFSMFIGIFFGYYPANKAAKLDPIDALRYE